MQSASFRDGVALLRCGIGGRACTDGGAVLSRGRQAVVVAQQRAPDAGLEVLREVLVVALSPRQQWRL